MLLHPLLLPTLAFFVLLFISPVAILSVRSEAKWPLLTLIFIMTFVIPVCGIYLYYLLGGTKDLFLEEAKDRKIPYIFATICYTFCTFLFITGDSFAALPALAVIIGSITVSIALVTVINFFWKISAHSVGISGVIGFITALVIKYDEGVLYYPLLITIILAGLLMSARLQLNAHTPTQILAGTMLGFSVSFLAIIAFL